MTTTDPGWRAFLLALLVGSASCATQVRVPLAVPLPAVGGTRPATPQGLEVIGEFGDGLWGQEQQRAEMRGLGIGLAGRDRIEVSSVSYHSTRSVLDENGEARTGESTSGVRIKVRLFDPAGGRMSVGLHVATLHAERSRVDVQDDRLTMWDLAVPVEIYPLATPSVDTRWGVYVGPRLVFQWFDDGLNARKNEGTLIAGFLGTAARWRFLAVAGELNLARPANMGPESATASSDWILLPAASIRLMLPTGR